MTSKLEKYFYELNFKEKTARNEGFKSHASSNQDEKIKKFIRKNSTGSSSPGLRNSLNKGKNSFGSGQTKISQDVRRSIYGIRKKNKPSVDHRISNFDSK